MALSYLFYPSQNNDRKYSVGDFKSYFAEIINEGVIPKTDSALKVIPSENMTVKIQNGTVFGNDGSMARVFGDGENVIIANADGTNTRIDYIVMRNSVSDRKFIPVYIKGEPSSSPSSPEILRDGDNYDYLLAKITVPRGTTEITQEMISDERYGQYGSMGGAFTSDQLSFDLKADKYVVGEIQDLITDEKLSIVSAVNEVKLGNDNANATSIRGININQFDGNGVLAKVGDNFKVLDTSKVLLSAGGTMSTGNIKNYTFDGTDFEKYSVMFASTLFGYADVTFEVARGETSTQTVSMVMNTSPVYTQVTTFSVNISADRTAVVLTDISTSTGSNSYKDVHFTLLIKGAI